ncbi:MAG: hypothetical protein K2Y71_05415 [Xanthobacteraceae bacterium]|nr:hypothetical protein [Xanthobacteraceae bacterium]
MAATSGDDDESIEEHKQALIHPAAMLYGVQKMFGDQARAKAKQAYGKLIDAHLLVAGVLGAGLLRTNGVVTPATATSEERNALFAGFVIGLYACESAIEEARYLQAHALLRQEMEILAQLKAVREGRRKPNGSLNVTALEKSLRQLYGDLTAAAHVSRRDVVESVTALGADGGSSGTDSHDPLLSGDGCRPRPSILCAAHHHDHPFDRGIEPRLRRAPSRSPTANAQRSITP